MFKVPKTDAVNNSPTSKDLIGPTDDDYDKTIATNLFEEGKPTKEMSDYAEELCEDSDEDPQNADLAREIVNGENFILHGEMTIANEDDQSSQSNEDSKSKLALPRQNPLLSLHRNRVAARVIEESMAETAEVVERVSSHRPTPAVSRRKSFGSKAPKHSKQPHHSKPTIVDLTVPNHLAMKKSKNKNAFVYSPTTYSRARALMEPEPTLQVRPSCHYYGTKRMQNQGGTISSTKQSTQSSPKPLIQPSPKQLTQLSPKQSPQPSPKQSIQPSPVKPRQLSASPLTKRPPSSSAPEPKPPSSSPRVITIEPDSTSSQGPAKSSKSSSSSRKGSKERSGLTLLDDDVFEYTPTPSTSSNNYEKLVKNEDRYSKYELGKMANDRHKKLFHKTAELNEKLKEIKDLEKKMSRMKGSITKLTNELKEKNRILETQSTELLDLEGSKSDCEIFINKLKDDLEECQKKLEARIQEVESANKRFHQTERQLEEQRRLHQNLSLAHSTTLQKIKDMVEERKKTDLLHTAQIQDKDVLIRKLEQGLAQKMETVNELVKDKRDLELLVLRERTKKASNSNISFTLKTPVDPVVKSPDEKDTIPNDLDSSQDSKLPMVNDDSPGDVEDEIVAVPSNRKVKPVIQSDSEEEDNSLNTSTCVKSEEETQVPKSPPKAARTLKRGRGISVKKLANMSPRGRGFRGRTRPLRKRVATRSSTSVINVDSDSTEPSPRATKSPKPAARPAKKADSPKVPPTGAPDKTSNTTSPNPTTPRTRIKSATSAIGRKRARSLITSGKKTPVVRKRSKSEVQPAPETEVSGKRKRKPACRYSPSENKMVPISDSPVTPTLDPEPAPVVQQPPDTPAVAIEEEEVVIPTDSTADDPSDKSTDKPTDSSTDKPTDSSTDSSTDKPSDNSTDNPGDKSTDKPIEKSTDNPDDKAADKPVEDVTEVKSTTKEDVPLVVENPEKVHTEYSKFMITAIEYESREQTSSKDEVDTAAEKSVKAKRELRRRNIEVPSFREMSPLMLIHQEGEQASVFSKYKEGDSQANYTRMHKKCETAEIRMMKQCERMRLQLEQRNNRKKLKEPPKIPSIVRELHCRSTDHAMSVAKCKHPCVSVFRCPLPAIKQRDFTLPWANEIKSFAYYAKSSSSRSAPDPAVTLNPGASQVETPQPPTTEAPASKPQITLIFSQSEGGIVVKKDETVTDIKSDNATVTPSVVTSGTEDLVNPAVKSTNIWSSIQTTMASNLDNGLSKNIFSKFGELRKTSSSGESSSKDAESVNSKRDRSSTDSNEQSPPKLPKIGVERRNIWESWCTTARTQVAPDQPSSSFAPSSSASEPQTSVNSQTVQNSADPSAETLSDSDDSPEMFDQKSFLLDACSSKERSPTLPPQPLTRKLEKLSKHKRPVLVCTNSSNSSPRPSDDSFESSPAKT